MNMQSAIRINQFKEERFQLIEQLRKRGITDENVLSVMSDLPRELFVKDGFERRAYEDSALPIGLQQTISQPFTVAFMTQKLQLEYGEKILEIGTGSGYQAAVLAKLGMKVFTIERHFDLYRQARSILAEMGFTVSTRQGDGTIGWKDNAPYDAIIVTAGAPDVPNSLVMQLRIGGRMILPIGDEKSQMLTLVRRIDNEHYEGHNLGEFRFVPLVGKEGWADKK